MGISTPHIFDKIVVLSKSGMHTSELRIRIDWLVCAEFGNDSSKIRDCQCGECMGGSLELMFKGGFSKCNFVKQSIGWFIKCFRIISPIMEM